MNTSFITRIIVLGLAILQPFTAYFSTFSASSLMETNDPTITPAGYAFVIWGVICVGSLAYALYQLLPGRRNKELYDAIAPYVVGVFAGFSIWLYAAGEEWLWVTVIIFIGMGLLLLKVFPTILKAVYQKKFSILEQVVTYCTFALYAGWTTVAIFANTASAIKFYGVSDLGTNGILWQTGILLLACIVSFIAISKTKGSVPYSLTILWAFIAVTIGTLGRANVAGILPWVAGIATCILLVNFLYIVSKQKKLS